MKWIFGIGLNGEDATEVGAIAPEGAPAVSNENGLSFEAQFELPRHAKNPLGRVDSNPFDIEPRWVCWEMWASVFFWGRTSIVPLKT